MDILPINCNSNGILNYGLLNKWYDTFRNVSYQMFQGYVCKDKNNRVYEWGTRCLSLFNRVCDVLEREGMIKSLRGLDPESGCFTSNITKDIGLLNIGIANDIVLLGSRFGWKSRGAVMYNEGYKRRIREEWKYWMKKSKRSGWAWIIRRYPCPPIYIHYGISNYRYNSLKVENPLIAKDILPHSKYSAKPFLVYPWNLTEEYLQESILPKLLSYSEIKDNIWKLAHPMGW